MLGGMNWKRGVLFAGVHFAIAATMIGWDADRVWHEEHAERGAHEWRLVETAWQEEEMAVPFDPCKTGYVCRWTTPQEEIVQMGNLPVYVLSGWKNPCPPAWTFAGVVQHGRLNRSLGDYFLVSAILCAAVPVEWFLIGAYPFFRRNRWFLEPSVLVTIFTSVSACGFPLTLLPPVGDFPELIFPFLGALAMLSWLFWFLLLAWSCAWAGWKLLARRRA
jgi:hypothetical protein